MHHPQRQNVTTLMVGLKNGHIRTNLTQNGGPQRYSWGTRRRRRVLQAIVAVRTSSADGGVCRRRHITGHVCVRQVGPLRSLTFHIVRSLRWPGGKVSASRAADLASIHRRSFSRSSHTSDFKIGTPVATLPGAWRYWVSAGTDRLSISIL